MGDGGRVRRVAPLVVQSVMGRIANDPMGKIRILRERDIRVAGRDNLLRTRVRERKSTSSAGAKQLRSQFHDWQPAFFLASNALRSYRSLIVTCALLMAVPVEFLISRGP